MTDEPTPRDLLQGLTREAVDAGTYGEPAPEMADEPTINRELMVRAFREQIVTTLRTTQWANGGDYDDEYTAHNRHSYHGRCAICVNDFDAIADAVLPIVEAETAAKDAEIERLRGLLDIAEAAAPATNALARRQRERAEKAERERDQALASLTKYAAEAHRRKWDHADDNQPAFDALHRLGDEILASRDRVLAALRQNTEAAP